MTPLKGTVLSKINSPTDLKLLNQKQLSQLADELRTFILDVVSVHPGHLGSSLGVVELTVALHYVFNTPYDKLIWDVGHQAYAHKILTGRRDNFYTNRTLGGISGFPSMKESEYDAFGTGHSSTSISAALGMAIASKQKGEACREHIAVVGDGALSAGMALEGLNNVGVTNSNILIILNDNGISIDKSVGAIGDYLSKMSHLGTYGKLRGSIWKGKGKAGNFFYSGPVDGHNIGKLIKALEETKKHSGPKILHIITKKGKGFDQAEKEQTTFHAPGKFNRETGELQSESLQKSIPTYQQVFGETMLELAKKDEKIIAITPAMPTGSALTKMMDKFPERVFDVGIAEQHAVTFAAGLAAEGMKPFCTIYSTFLQRAYDQIIHDVALQNLPVVFCIDRAGLVGGDGATHHGVFDLAFLSPIPNMVIAAPMDETELRNLLYTATEYQRGPFAIRYPRGEAINKEWQNKFKKIEIGKGRKILDGEKTAILTIGHPGNYALEAAKILENKNIQPAIFDMRFLKPLDEKLLHKVFDSFKNIITVEDGTVVGGLGSAVIDFANANNYKSKITKLGVPDRFIEHGSKKKLVELCGFDSEGIAETVLFIVN